MTMCHMCHNRELVRHLLSGGEPLMCFKVEELMNVHSNNSRFRVKNDPSP